jgi:hypothetical protein
MRAPVRSLTADSNALGSSSGVRTSSDRSLSPNPLAAACVSSNRDAPGLEGSATRELQRNATRVRFGIVSLTSSNRLQANSGARLEKPVRFPPGREKLATSPRATGSPPRASATMGIVVVAFLAARATWTPPYPATTTSTLRRTRSPARSGSRSYFPSAHRLSMTMFLPSI